jgi:integrase
VRLVRCTQPDPPLPASGADVATFLASERQRGLAPNTIDLRRAAIRYLHRAAGCPVPTDDVCVAETVAGIRRDAAAKGQMPAKKAAATASIIRQFLAPIADDPRGLRDKALILVGFAGALRRSELAAIRVEQLEQTERGLRLSIARTKGAQTTAVTIPLPYGQTELCPVRALARWREVAGITSGPVFRRIWLPKQQTAGEPPAPPRIGTQPISPLCHRHDDPGARRRRRVCRRSFWRAQPETRGSDDGHGTRRPPGRSQTPRPPQKF